MLGSYQSLTPLATLPPQNKCRNYRRNANPPELWQQSGKRTISKITLKKKSGLLRSWGITSPVTPPVKLPQHSNIQKGDSVLKWCRSKWKGNGSSSDCLCAQLQEKVKTEAALFGLPQSLGVTDSVILFNVSTDQTEKGFGKSSTEHHFTTLPWHQDRSCSSAWHGNLITSPGSVDPEVSK